LPVLAADQVLAALRAMRERQPVRLNAFYSSQLGSAERSRLTLAGSRAEIRDIIVRTTAASGVRDGAIRYGLSAGPGNLDLTPAAGAAPGFFVMVFTGLAYSTGVPGPVGRALLELLVNDMRTGDRLIDVPY
jgi:hypothetical protein